MVPDASELEAVMRYHERTKHHFKRYAAGPGELDWANQPDPFRRYAGAVQTRLPVLGPEEEPVSPAYESLYARAAVPGAPVNLRTLSRLLEYALALSAWKQGGRHARAGVIRTEVRALVPARGLPGTYQ